MLDHLGIKGWHEDICEAVAVDVANGGPADVCVQICDLLCLVAPVVAVLRLRNEQENAVRIVSRQEDVRLLGRSHFRPESHGISRAALACRHLGRREARGQHVASHLGGGNVLAVEAVGVDRAIGRGVVGGQQLQAAVAVEVLPGAGEAGARRSVQDPAGHGAVLLHVPVHNPLSDELRCHQCQALGVGLHAEEEVGTSCKLSLLPRLTAEGC
mmetsp:Transcript_6330/g.11867  ORF Transcript_6330/g.11867 Transcript_6330/m.11867 type:complete len:213 (-) Transcript_6330:657-1295(-)